ncbi:hypothetical protein PYCCODRAFT_679895 [Trametes coccinea BRFM310]|uniref:Uncharacterized protein n=1 Tax=Trametes coccinea (strain BRFM310) TaxID=1353009 RepID=A0A1Y2IGX5_TRAC3|nr:hypothetical protein PYCCODRAFT_679895 [Trametes coccinea BRFM310]
MSSHFLPEHDFATMSDGIGHHRTLASSVWPPVPKGFVDIFDVPERLSSFTPSLYSPQKPAQTIRATQRPAVQDLPPPILFDGPARASVNRTAPIRQSQRTRAGEIQRPLVGNPTPRQPSALVFDGPSRLRPYSYNARGPLPAGAKVSLGIPSPNGAYVLKPYVATAFFCGI